MKKENTKLMLLSASININEKYPEYADEITIYNPSSFIKLDSNKQYHFVIEDVTDIPPLDKIESNVVYSSPVFATVEYLIDKGYPIFYQGLVRDWYTFKMLAEMGVPQIRIAEPIIFDTETILKYKEKYPNLKIRAWGNRAHITNVTDWFLRPEDIDMYEGIIDILELSSVAALELYHNKQYLLDIKDYLPQSTIPSVSNPMFDKKDFAEKRMKCKQRCITSCSACRNCSLYFDFLAVTERNFKNGF